MERGTVVGGALLIAGTTIGGAMLALPLSTGLAGFGPSALLLLVVWVFSLIASFSLLEACLWHQEECNFITLVQETLGGKAKAWAWVLYLFLLYCLLTGYLAGCGSFFLDAIQGIGGPRWPPWVGPTVFFAFFGTFLYFGIRPLDLVNRLLMSALFLALLVLIAFLLPHFEVSNIEKSNPPMVFSAVAIVGTAFGYQIIIPSLVHYMDYDSAKLKKTVFLGGMIPLLVYLLWSFVVLGVLPITPDLLSKPDPERAFTLSLQKHFGETVLSFGFWIFSFLTILTSLLGVALSLADFLVDGLKIKRTRLGQLKIVFLTLGPPLFFSIYFKNVFLNALSFAAYGVMLLLFILPALMVWVGRFRDGREASVRVCGGRPVLFLLIVFSLIVTGFITNSLLFS